MPTENPAAENAIGTVGAVLWSIQVCRVSLKRHVTLHAACFQERYTSVKESHEHIDNPANRQVASIEIYSWSIRKSYAVRFSTLSLC